MTFANPWGLLGLLALPAIVLIHLYHRRFPVLPVAGLHLWGVETKVRSAGRTRERLPVTPSLLLELLAALLLTLVLSRPQFGSATGVQHLVVVLDNSASMSAVPAGDSSFRNAAIDVIDRRMDALGRRGAITILLTGPRPTMLIGPAVPWDEAKRKLELWQPRLPRHDFGPTWDLAAQLAEKATGLLFLTDRVPGKESAVPQSMECVAVGRPLGNISVSSARWNFDSVRARGNVFLRIENRGAKPADVVVTGRSGEREVFRKTVPVAANGSVPLESEVPGGLGQILVTASAPLDGLELDSRISLIEPQVRTVTVAVDLPAEDPAIAPLNRVIKALPDVQSADRETASLVISPGGELPASRRDLWWLGMGPLDRTDEAKKKAVDLADRTPYLLDKRHPLLNGVTLSGIVWGGVQPLDVDGVPLISSGSHRLLVQPSGTQTTGYILNMDVARSNLPESPDWPIFLSNLIELRRDALPGLRQWNYRLNEQIRFRLFEGTKDPTEDQALTLWHNGESRPLARSAVVDVPQLDDVGVYEVRDGDRVFGRFAVNFFDTAESNLAALDSGTREAVEPVSDVDYEIDNPYSWVLLLGIVLIVAAALADWRVLRGKAT